MLLWYKLYEANWSRTVWVWIVCAWDSCRWCHSVCYHVLSLLFKVSYPGLLGVLPLLAWRLVRAINPVQPVAADANPLQRQPARADPCSLHLLLVLGPSPARSRWGLVLTCNRLGLVFGHHDRAVRLPAGLDTELPPATVWELHKRVCLGEMAMKEAFSVPSPFLPTGWLNSETATCGEGYHSGWNYRQPTQSLSS